MTPTGHVDVAAAAGVTYRQLDYWVRRGYLLPDNPSGGTGSVRGWTREELRVAAMMWRLVAVGFLPQVAHRVARAGGRCELAPGVLVEVS